MSVSVPPHEKVLRARNYTALCKIDLTVTVKTVMQIATYVVLKSYLSPFLGFENGECDEAFNSCFFANGDVRFGICRWL